MGYDYDNETCIGGYLNGIIYLWAYKKSNILKKEGMEYHFPIRYMLIIASEE